MTDRGLRRIELLLISPVLMWAIVAAGISLIFRYAPDRVLFHRGIVSMVILALGVVNWVYFFIGTVIANPSAPRSAAAIRAVSTTGVYAKARHPIYSADIFLAWSAFLMYPTRNALLSIIWLTIVVVLWMKLEEWAMLSKFGEEYASYRARTPMILPRYLRR